jgi:hypothetical protein
MLSHLIEAGTVKAGIICSGENISKVVHTTCNQLLGDTNITREKILQMLPTLTLGCGAVAAVLCHDSISSGGHKFVGGVARSASQHHQLCIGNGDFSVGQGEEIAPIMTSDAAQLMIAAAKLGGRAFPDVTVSHGDATEADLAGIDGVFLDPARRTAGHNNTKRQMNANDWSPSLTFALDSARGVAAGGACNGRLERGDLRRLPGSLSRPRRHGRVSPPPRHPCRLRRPRHQHPSFAPPCLRWEGLSW